MRPLRWSICVAILTLFQACFAPSVRAGGTNAAIPYQDLEEMFQPIATVDAAKLQVHLFVGSTNKAVRASDITLTIHSKARGLIPVRLGTNGQILDFPLAKDLHRENPFVMANQPAGSISMWVTIQLPPTNALTFPYRRLADGVAEMNRDIKAQAGLMMSVLAPRVQGVAFLFPKASAGKATVTIESATGRKIYTADKHGNVVLKLDKALVAENPLVTVSEKPQHIVPDMSDMK